MEGFILSCPAVRVNTEQAAGPQCGTVRMHKLSRELSPQPCFGYYIRFIKMTAPSAQGQGYMEERFNTQEWRFFVASLKGEARSILQEVGSDADPEKVVESALEDLQALAPRDPEEEDRSKEEIWRQVREVLLKAAYATRPHCIRCGTCCTMGSPTLMTHDLELLRRAFVKPHQIVAIRVGENAYSNRTQKVERVEREYLKVKEKPGTRTCIFYDPDGPRCTIYETRPHQCRVQECWDPEAEEGLNYCEPMSRASVLEGAARLWDIVLRHEERCSFDDLSRAMARLGATKGQSVEEVLDLIRYDHHVREFAREQFDLDENVLDMIFGRPLSDAVRPYGLVVEQQPDGSFMLTVSEEYDESGDR